MPKNIVIAGGGRNVGKTTLARRLADLLPESVVVKIGHHPPQSGKNSNYFLIGTPFRKIIEQLPPGEFRIIESGSILDDSDFRPDLVIFLPAKETDKRDKPGSGRRRARADVVRGEVVPRARAHGLADQLGIGVDLLHEIIECVNI